MSEIDVYKEWLGIPEGVRPPDHYTLLRLIQFEDDIEKIRSNYRKLNAHVRKYSTGQYLVRSQELLNEMAKAMLCLTDPEGKREYDESLGREPAEIHEDEPKTVLEYLVSKNIIKRSQLSEIEHFAEARGLNHRDAVIQMKLAEPADATRALAVELRLPFVELEDMLPEDDVLDKIPRRLVKKHSCLPLFEDRGRMLVACIDEPSPALEDEIRMRCGHPMRAVLAVPRSINQAIAKYYAPGMRDEAAPVEESPDSIAPKRGKSANSKTEKPKAEKPKAAPKTESAPISEGERRQQMQLSLIGICWSIIGTVAVFYFTGSQLRMELQIGIAVCVGAVVGGILKATYWK